MDRKNIRQAAWPLLLVAFWLLVYLAGRGTGITRQVSYDAFEAALAQGRVERVQATDTLLIGHLAKEEEGVTDLAAERVEPERR